MLLFSDIYGLVKNGGREMGEQKGKGEENRRNSMVEMGEGQRR